MTVTENVVGSDNLQYANCLDNLAGLVSNQVRK